MPDAIDTTDDFLSVPQAAREIGCADATVLSKVIRGELEAKVIAGRTFITQASVHAYKRRHGLTEPEAAARVSSSAG